MRTSRFVGLDPIHSPYQGAFLAGALVGKSEGSPPEGLGCVWVWTDVPRACIIMGYSSAGE